jgi:hypothetical protein
VTRMCPLHENSVSLRIGGMVLSISSETSIESVTPTDPLYPFLCSGRPDVRVRCRSVSLRGLRFPVHRILYTEGNACRIYKLNKRILTVFGPVEPAGMPYLMASSTEDCCDVAVYSNRSYGVEFSLTFLSRLLQYPLLPIIMVYSLVSRAGLMVHGCGIAVDGKGYLFAGKSGEGKSTMARLWKNKGLVLNDERVIIRRSQGHSWLYGTPWTGEHGSPSPQGVPLESIFFLNHGNGHHADRAEKMESAAMLLARSFPPLWDDQALGRCLDFISGVVEEIPCYRLGFAPNEGVADFVRCLT